MKKASKYVNGSLDGYVEKCSPGTPSREPRLRVFARSPGKGFPGYEFALSKRLQYDESDDLEMAWRYEYDGLNLLRMDEVYDSTGDGNLANDLARDNWRIRETSTHRPPSRATRIAD